MIVAIHRDDIEHHAAECFLQGIETKTKFVDNLEVLRVAVRASEIEVESRDTAQRLHMNALANFVTIEALGHEVRPRPFFEKPRLAHEQSGCACHQIVRVFDASVARNTIAVLSTATANLVGTGLMRWVSVSAIQFDQPVRKAIGRGDLSGSDRSLVSL